MTKVNSNIYDIKKYLKKTLDTSVYMVYFSKRFDCRDTTNNLNTEYCYVTYHEP